MHVIGEKSRLDTDIQKAIAEIEDLSREKASCEWRWCRGWYAP